MENIKFQIIIVLYKMKVEESPTFSSLIKCYEEIGEDKNLIEVIFYDNSPISQVKEIGEIEIPFKYEYVWNKENGGLAEAYNYALMNGRNEECTWLLLLDQDTNLDRSYLKVLSERVRRSNKDVVALVPTIYDKETLISPSRIGYAGKNKSMKVDIDGVNSKVTAFNSCAAINISFLESIGGFDNRFKIDMLDHWLFDQIYINNYFVDIYPCSIYHELSVRDYDSLNLNRYINIIKSENIFYKECRSGIEFLVFKIKLVLRTLKQLIVYRRNDIAYETMKCLFLGNRYIGGKNEQNI